MKKDVIKKYKHKPTGKEYIQTIINSFPYYGVITNVTKISDCIPAYIVESGNDWEEIVQKDYEILSLVDRSGNIIYKNNDYRQGYHVYLTLEELMNSVINLSIHSVRRLSDGEVFTIGDTVNHKNNVTNPEGMIMRFDILSNGIWFKTHNYNVPMSLVEGKVKPKDYIITAFRVKKNPNNDFSGVLLYHRNNMGMYSALTQHAFSEEWMLESNGYDIYSVVRLSDNIEFKIGDKLDTVHYKNKYGVIKKFDIVHNKIAIFGSISWSDNIIPTAYLDDLIKVVEKPVLFTTEDGVDIYEGDSFFQVCPKGSWELELATVRNPNYPKKQAWLAFSTREAAEEYIVMNKPCLSLNDIERVIKPYYKKKQIFMHTFKMLIKDRLKL